MPSTSTRWSAACAAVTTRWERPSTVSRTVKPCSCSTVGVDERAVDGDPVAVRADLGDLDLVRGRRAASGRRRGRGRAVPRAGRRAPWREARALDLLGLVVGVDARPRRAPPRPRRGRSGRHGCARGRSSRCRRCRASTSGRSSRSSRKDLFVVPPSMTTVVSMRARRRRASASCAGGPVGDDLGDHRVEVGGDDVALADAGVDADAGADGQAQQGDAAGRGREVAVGVLGVEPGLDGVAGAPERGSASSLSPPATWSCSRTRSMPVVSSVTGCSTCSRVLTSRKAKVRSCGW